jgi:hypothetical protein
LDIKSADKFSFLINPVGSLSTQVAVVPLEIQSNYPVRPHPRAQRKVTPRRKEEAIPHNYNTNFNKQLTIRFGVGSEECTFVLDCEFVSSPVFGKVVLLFDNVVVVTTRER